MKLGHFANLWVGWHFVSFIVVCHHHKYCCTDVLISTWVIQSFPTRTFLHYCPFSLLPKSLMLSLKPQNLSFEVISCLISLPFNPGFLCLLLHYQHSISITVAIIFDLPLLVLVLVLFCFLCTHSLCCLQYHRCCLQYPALLHSSLHSLLHCCLHP